jgi:type IX secretion system PorP/SprF family membrane protein
MVVLGLWGIIGVPVTRLHAQQETIYSQYMFNRLAVNPAYSGTKGLVSLTALYRMQWVNLDGSPRSFSFTGHGATRNMRHGFGAMFLRDNLGAQNSTLFGVNYAFRIPLDGRSTSNPRRTFLSFGLQANGLQFELDGSKVRTFQSDDPAFGNGSESVIVPDLGAGVFFNTSMLYIGFSVAHLNEPEINLFRNEDSRLDRHYFLTAGVDLPLTKDRSYLITPSIFYRVVRSADPQLDLNLNFMMVQTFWIGAGYRLDDAAVLMAGFYPLKQLRIGYSYDLTTSKLRSHQNGSHEIMISYDFGNPNKVRVVTPRYF